METIAYVFALILTIGVATGCFTMVFAGMNYIHNLRPDSIDYEIERKKSIKMIVVLVLFGAVAVIGVMQILKQMMGVIA